MRHEDFVKQSWVIEGESLSPGELTRIAKLHRDFMPHRTLSVRKLCILALDIWPDASKGLRNIKGRDVRVGMHVPPAGGPEVEAQLRGLLEEAPALSPFDLYCRFETLHPFTDGNGRLGRALWLWAMRGDLSNLFLQAFHYQALENWGRASSP